MQPHFGILWLVAITVITLLLGADELMHGIQSPLPVLDLPGHFEFVLRVFHGDSAAVKTGTPECLESNIDETIVVDWTCKFDVTKVSRIRLVMEVT